METLPEKARESSSFRERSFKSSFSIDSISMALHSNGKQHRSEGRGFQVDIKGVLADERRWKNFLKKIKDEYSIEYVYFLEDILSQNSDLFPTEKDYNQFKSKIKKFINSGPGR